MKRLLLIALATAGCADGFGEAATGTVDVTLASGMTVLDDLRIERAFLSIGEIELEPAAPTEPPPDDHGHAHAHLGVRGAAPAVLEGMPIELLGGEHHLGSVEADVAHYETAHLLLVPGILENDARCSLYVAGTATLGEELVPLQLCIPAGVDVIVPIELDVEHELESSLGLLLDFGALLHDVHVDELERFPSSPIRINEVENRAAYDRIRGNLAGSIVQIHVEPHDDHAHE